MSRTHCTPPATLAMGLTLAAGLCLVSGCTRGVPQQVPPVTCWWLDAVQATGPKVRTDDGVDLQALAEAMVGREVPTESEDWLGSLVIKDIELLET